jgi:phage regulator Rha-like protein
MGKELIPLERIEKRIILLRGQKVILDRDLAELYEVQTSILKRAVKRNIERFPDDFMFVINNQELTTLRCQFGTSKTDPRGGTRYNPMVFTEQGVAMLSSVLNNRRAVQMNITIMRAFVRLRHILASHTELARKLDELEKKYDEQFRVVFEAMRELMTPPDPPQQRIGFAADNEGSP